MLSTYTATLVHVRPPQMPAGAMPQARATASTRLSIERDAEIVAQGDPAEYCYRVVSGCVRTLRLLEDGRRQIREFLLPGDIFGWESLDEHDFTAEAVTAVTVERFSFGMMTDRNRQDGALSSEISLRLAAQIRRAGQHVVLLGRKTASERIATFLMDMAQRLPGGSGGTIGLPMNRVDIADYLGLTIETVCRRLMELRRNGTIAITKSRIAILRPGALASTCCD